MAGGDSLLQGHRFGELDLDSGPEQHQLTGQAVDLDALNRILG